MDFFLMLLLAGALVYLWRRADALQVQIRHLEEIVEGLRFQLTRQNPAPLMESELVERAAKEVALKPADGPQSEESRAPQAVPAKRNEEAPASVSAPATRSYEVEDEVQEPRKPRFQFDFEDFFGRLLPIWAGGIALAVAGFFLVRYSIEQGLLGPQVRVALGFVFGGLLLGGAEIAYRQEHRLADPRVRQALAGAGLATLYASFYLAGSLYGLVGSTIAFLGLAGVTMAAILLSFRFGLPSAILGLVGGFAAPMLVASEEANVPVLALYLALVTGGLTYAGNKQGRSWLALAALAGGLGWGVLMLFSGVTGFTDVLAFGGYLVVLGAIVPAFTAAESSGGLAGSRTVRLGASILAAIQMAAMVAQSGFSVLGWGLYGLLAAALAFFAWREPRLRESSAFAAILAVFMLAIWDVELGIFALVGTGLTTIFVGVPLAHIWRGEHRTIDAFQLGGFALSMIALTYEHSWSALSSDLIALVSLGLAMLPLLAAYRFWPTKTERIPFAGIVTLAFAVTGVAIAGLIAAPLWASPLVMSAVALGVIALGWEREDAGLTVLTWTASAITLLSLLATSMFEPEFGRLFGLVGETNLLQSVLRWAATSLPFAALALRAPRLAETHIAEIAGSLLIYGVIAQFAPGNTLAWCVAGGAIALTLLDRDRLSARLTLAAIATAWAAWPIAQWWIGASSALVAEPMLIAGDIGWHDIGLRLLPLLAVSATFILRPAELMKGRLVAAGIFAGAVAAITGHIVFKQLFGLETFDQFTALGLAERTLWQAVLLGGGIAVMKLAGEKAWSKPVSAALLVAALAHFTLFTLGWHNPLWDEQAVGRLPIANLLLPAYGIAIGAALLLRRLLASSKLLRPWLFDAVIMVLISMLALSELRHVFAGTILSDDPVGQTEDLLRSVVGIVLAIGFLLWGARSQSRSWRIGSLVLMVAAVLKVFLFDASGLDGLIRVASFVALGFSLIGIGWFYTRQLASAAAKEA